MNFIDERKLLFLVLNSQYEINKKNEINTDEIDELIMNVYYLRPNINISAYWNLIFEWAIYYGFEVQSRRIIIFDIDTVKKYLEVIDNKIVELFLKAGESIKLKRCNPK